VTARCRLALVAVLLSGAAACSSTPSPTSDAAPAPDPVATATAASSPPPSAAPPAFRSSRTLVTAAVPVRLRIPALGVDAPVGRVGQAADGTVQVPTRWEEVGWFDRGARPGDAGPAVLLGHVDSRTGPAVFLRLPRVRTSDVVEVTGADRVVRRFRVTSVREYPKVRFPTEAVYLPVLRPELRLVTCGGAFDPATGHYLDNVVVSADLIQ
jgi:sortase (surface protein transpeptidase)